MYDFLNTILIELVTKGLCFEIASDSFLINIKHKSFVIHLQIFCFSKHNVFIIKDPKVYWSTLRFCYRSCFCPLRIEIYACLQSMMWRKNIYLIHIMQSMNWKHNVFNYIICHVVWWYYNDVTMTLSVSTMLFPTGYYCQY